MLLFVIHRLIKHIFELILGKRYSYVTNVHRERICVNESRKDVTFYCAELHITTMFTDACVTVSLDILLLHKF